MISHRFTSLLLLLSTLPAVAQFTEIASPLPKPPFACVWWGDFDNDGDLGLLVTGVTSASPVSAALSIKRITA